MAISPVVDPGKQQQFDELYKSWQEVSGLTDSNSKRKATNLKNQLDDFTFNTGISQPSAGYKPPVVVQPLPPNPLSGGKPEDYAGYPTPLPGIPPIQQDPETNPALYDVLKKPLGTDTSSADAIFKDLLSNINDKAALGSQGLNDLLGQIDQDTANQVGSLKSDFLDRGLGGPGQISDIEAAGLGDLRSGAVKAKSAARLGLAQTGVNDVNSALATKYSTTADFLKNDTTEQNKRDIALGQLLQQQELERLARKAGKYKTYAPVQPDSGPNFSFPISIPLGGA